MSKTKVRIPASAGEEVTVNYGGDVVHYPANDHIVNVDDLHLETFLGLIEGSNVANPVTNQKDGK